MNSPDAVDELVRQVRASVKYAAIDPSFVRSLVIQELGKRRSPKEVLKAVRGKLHQVASAYLEHPIDYGLWHRKLATLPADLHHPDTHAFCRALLQEHTSTRERLPYLESFFNICLESIAPLESILDLACGLNPLALPWMPLSTHASIFACDIYGDQVDFLNGFFNHYSINGRAAVCDLSAAVPTMPAQVAFLLKAIPCLEQVDKNIGRRLLEGINCQHLLITFPSHSLGGRGKGMRQNYQSHFYDLIEGLPFRVRQYDFPAELAFLLSRD